MNIKEELSPIHEYRNAMPDEESLDHFLQAMADFDRKFCEAMHTGTDFTLRLEIHGNAGEMLHARVHSDSFRRPCGVERRIEKKTRKSTKKG